jgi:hypothetical protein
MPVIVDALLRRSARLQAGGAGVASMAASRSPAIGPDDYLDAALVSRTLPRVKSPERLRHETTIGLPIITAILGIRAHSTTKAVQWVEAIS